MPLKLYSPSSPSLKDKLVVYTNTSQAESAQISFQVDESPGAVGAILTFATEDGARPFYAAQMNKQLLGDRLKQGKIELLDLPAVTRIVRVVDVPSGSGLPYEGRTLIMEHDGFYREELFAQARMNAARVLVSENGTIVETLKVALPYGQIPNGTQQLFIEGAEGKRFTLVTSLDRGSAPLEAWFQIDRTAFGGGTRDQVSLVDRTKEFRELGVADLKKLGLSPEKYQYEMIDSPCSIIARVW